jgi:ATP-dependent RNA helicase DeaD
MTTLFLNAGRKHLVTTAEIVGKVAGVTRLPAAAVGAIDIHQRHSLIDVAADQADLVLRKMNGIRIRGHALKVSLATVEEKARD